MTKAIGSKDRSEAPRNGAPSVSSGRQALVVRQAAADRRTVWQAGRPGLGSVMLEDVSISALHAALNGLAERQRAVSDDIANVNTPFYRARSVAFEGSLKQALADGEDPLTSTRGSVSFSTAPVGLTFSNVDLAAETVTGVNTQLAYDLALRATGDRFTLLRTAAKGA